MKKYVKPQLFMESFELTNHIANGCEIKLLDESNIKCQGEVLVENAFGNVVADFDVCGSNTITPEIDEWMGDEGYCYYKFANILSTIGS